MVVTLSLADKFWHHRRKPTKSSKKRVERKTVNLAMRT